MFYRLFATTSLIVSVLLSPAHADAQSQESQPWSIVVLSDIHVYTDATLERNLVDLVQCLVDLKPRLVVLTGDSTNGNKEDKHSKQRADSWWTALKASLEPFGKAGIPVLPVAGNHDYYRDVHKAAYRDAWSDLATSVAPLTLKGPAPVFYSTEIDGVHLSFAHVVTQRLGSDLKSWLEEDLAGAAGAKSKIVFGHVPFSTILGKKPIEDFKNELGGLLARHGVAAYVSGHEHLAWDEVFKISGNNIRQLIVGTASASYNFPINLDSFNRNCQGTRCTMPGNGKTFKLKNASSREQEQPRVFGLIEIFDGKPTFHLKAFKPQRPAVNDRLAPKDFSFNCNGEIVPFEAHD